MRKSIELQLLVVSILLVAVVGLEGAPASGDPLETANQKRPTFTVEKLFDYQVYKKLFNKSYSGWREQVARAKYFMSRAIRVVISAWKYSNREQNHFLAINHLSDYSQQELDKMRNQELDKRRSNLKKSSNQLQSQGGNANEVDDDSLPEFEIADGENAFKTLTELLEARKTEPFYAEMLDLLKSLQDSDNTNKSETATRMHELAQAHKGSCDHGEIEKKLKMLTIIRHKRELTSTDKDSNNNHNKTKGSRPKRNVPIDRLINLGKSMRLPPEVSSKIPDPKLIVGRNPKHKQPELFSQGMVDQQVPLKMLEMPSKVDNVGRYLERLSHRYKPQQSALNQLTNQIRDQDSSSSDATSADLSYDDDASSFNNQPDEVFVDLRQSNCFVLPRDQGTCGSCYAFSSIAMMEYLHCIKTGQLVLFSEQYVIDCGKQYFGDYVFGCNGGISEEMPAFFQNFGLELRSYYPYLRREDVCPYAKETNLDHAGYFRVDVEASWKVPLSRFVDVLEFSPVLVIVMLDDDFAEYGGGVHLARCKEDSSSHAMLLIGHGREDNEEYWLMRNSYSVSWGEGGYYKMSKRSECICENEGFIFGTSDGKNLDLEVRSNELHNEELILDHYLNTVFQ